VVKSIDGSSDCGAVPIASVIVPPFFAPEAEVEADEVDDELDDELPQALNATTEATATATVAADLLGLLIDPPPRVGC